MYRVAITTLNGGAPGMAGFPRRAGSWINYTILVLGLDREAQVIPAPGEKNSTAPAQAVSWEVLLDIA